jgi:hypothetical protein
MTHVLDARRFLDTFNASHDPHVPGLVFSLLNSFSKLARSNSTRAPFRIVSR